MKDLTIIIPVCHKNEFTDEIQQSYHNLFKSMDSSKETVGDSKIIIVGDEKEISNVLPKEGISFDFTVLNKPEELESKEQVLINYAVGKTNTKYFTVLTSGDVITSIWLKNVKEYIEFVPEVALFLPIVECYGKEEGDKEPRFLGFSNEAVWASSFSEKIGYFDEQSLLDFMYFTPYGGVFNTESFKNAGMLKESMETFYWYELLLRLTHLSFHVLVIPKIGTHHIIEDSGLDMSKNEYEFWLETAKKEYLFKKDRKKTYNA